MTLEVKPVGVTCNLRCTYCYEEPMRDVAPVHKYDKVAVMKQLETATNYWSLFGGEALLLPIKDLEELLALGFKKWGRTGVQTNGTLITDAHIELFDKYRTGVGISMDGPGELNDSRWASSLATTRAATLKSETALYKLLELARAGKSHLRPSLIVTLQKTNASEDRWPRMKEWMTKLDEMGLKHINFHLMEMDSDAHELYLPHERLKTVMLDLWEFSTTLKNIRFLNFNEITDLLRGRDEDAMCVWKSCDPWNTAAVQGIENDGSPSKCGRANKDGIDWIPSEGTSGAVTVHSIGGFVGTTSHERQLSLYVTPKEHGGCKGCRFWIMCKGHCPGTGNVSGGKLLGDWRLRSSHCQTYIDMFEEGEKRILASGELPLSLSPNLKKLEQIMYKGWIAGENISISEAAARLLHEQNPSLGKPAPRGSNIIHGDSANGVPHGDAPHGDIPHGDEYFGVDGSHGDHHGDRHGDSFGPSMTESPILRAKRQNSVTTHADKHGDHTDSQMQN